MLILAHRANVDGPGPAENEPEQIERCLDSGFGVEVDLWHIDGRCYFGHDDPRHPADLERFDRDGVVFHLKNPWLPALARADAFAICNDPFALTLRGRIWTNYDQPAGPASIVCAPELVGAEESLADFVARHRHAAGICTDHPLRVRELLEA